MLGVQGPYYAQQPTFGPQHKGTHARKQRLAALKRAAYNLCQNLRVKIGPFRHNPRFAHCCG